MEKTKSRKYKHYSLLNRNFKRKDLFKIEAKVNIKQDISSFLRSGQNFFVCECMQFIGVAIRKTVCYLGINSFCAISTKLLIAHSQNHKR